jgi:pimeloyl-ACP methyl ester carboxylesterase
MLLKILRLFFSVLNILSSGYAAKRAVAIFYSPRRFEMANWERNALSAGTPTTLSFDGEVLDATIWENTGPTVLLVHGWEGRRAQLGKIGLALNGLSYRVVAFDGPAHGSSNKKRTTLVEFSRAVAAAAEHFGPVHTIVGHSFGAAATGIAVRKGTVAQQIVLISCPFSLRHVVSGFARMVGVPHRSHEKMYPIMEQLHDCPESELSFATIGPDLNLPCLMIHDLKDRYVPADDADRVHLTIANSELIKTNGLGHMRILQDENVVRRVVGFVCQLPTDAAAQVAVQ